MVDSNADRNGVTREGEMTAVRAVLGAGATSTSVVAVNAQALAAAMTGAQEALTVAATIVVRADSGIVVMGSVVSIGIRIVPTVSVRIVAATVGTSMRVVIVGKAALTAGETIDEREALTAGVTSTSVVAVNAQALAAAMSGAQEALTVAAMSAATNVVMTAAKADSANAEREALQVAATKGADRAVKTQTTRTSPPRRNISPRIRTSRRSPRACPPRNSTPTRFAPSTPFPARTKTLSPVTS